MMLIIAVKMEMTLNAISKSSFAFDDLWCEGNIVGDNMVDELVYVPFSLDGSQQMRSNVGVAIFTMSINLSWV